jgi:hypothetical protein
MTIRFAMLAARCIAVILFFDTGIVHALTGISEYLSGGWQSWGFALEAFHQAWPCR